MMMQRLENRLEREQILRPIIDDENVDAIGRRLFARRRVVPVRRCLHARHAFPDGDTPRFSSPLRSRGTRSSFSLLSSDESVAAICAIGCTCAAGTQRMADA